MKTHALYPLTFCHIYKNYLWGGNRISEQYHRANTPTPCAESWELSGMPGCASIIAHGAFEGIGLDELTATFGRDLIGEKALNPEEFPLLVKVLDAHQRLSVQVHPDKAVAARLGGRPKHEMWYILDAEENAGIWAGMDPQATLEDLPEKLLFHKTHPGEIYDLPAGLVHAIGAGNFIYEVQQTSDTTYRIDDWGRGRQLHLDEARQALKPELRPIRRVLEERHRHLHLAKGMQGFDFATLDLIRPRTLRTTAQSFMILFCAYGKTTLEHMGPHPLTLLPGDLVLVPPKLGIALTPLAPSKLLVTTL
jgi:mannose-6-phosphate isomerase